MQVIELNLIAAGFSLIFMYLSMILAPLCCVIGFVDLEFGLFIRFEEWDSF
jgi:hypothetical protein